MGNPNIIKEGLYKMTKRTKIFSLSLSTLAIVAAPIATVSCGEKSDTYVVTAKARTFTFGGTATTGKKVAAMVSDPENPRWQAAKSELQAAGGEVGFTTTTAIEKEQAAQNSWVTSQMTGASAADVLILGAADSGSASAAVSAAGTKPVVAYDRLINAEASNYNWYVTYDNALVGKMQGVDLINGIYGTSLTHASELSAITAAVTTAKATVTGKKHILALAGSPTDNNAKLFFGGAYAVINAAIAGDSDLAWKSWANTATTEEARFTAVAQANWNYTTGQSKVETDITNLGAEKSNIKAVLCPNDGMATAAINALRNKALDPKTIYITGQDSNDAAILSISETVNPGQNMTIMKPDNAAARMSMTLATLLIDGAAKDAADADDSGALTNAEIDAYLKLAYPGISFTIDTTQYTVGTASPKKAINTILLNPVQIYKSNYATYFDIKKK